MRAAGTPVSGSNATMTAFSTGEAGFGVAGGQRDQLRCEDAERWNVAGHVQESCCVVLLHERRRPARHRGAAGAQVRQRHADRIDQRVEIEQRFDVATVEDQHQIDKYRRMRLPCRVRKARATTPLRFGGGASHVCAGRSVFSPKRSK